MLTSVEPREQVCRGLNKVSRGSMPRRGLGLRTEAVDRSGVCGRRAGQLPGVLPIQGTRKARGFPFAPDPLLWEQDVSHSKHSQNIKQYTGLPSSCGCAELVCGLPFGLPDRLRRGATQRNTLIRSETAINHAELRLPGRSPPPRVTIGDVCPTNCLKTQRTTEAPEGVRDDRGSASSADEDGIG